MGEERRGMGVMGGGEGLGGEVGSGGVEGGGLGVGLEGGAGMEGDGEKGRGFVGWRSMRYYYAFDLSSGAFVHDPGSSEIGFLLTESLPSSTDTHTQRHSPEDGAAISNHYTSTRQCHPCASITCPILEK